MSASAEIRIVPVPRGLLGEVFRLALPYLIKGAAVSELDDEELAADLLNGNAVLWCIFVDDNMTAAFFTAVHADDDGRFLNIYGFGGEGVRVWIDKLQDVMEDHAARNECRSVRFYGRRAWGRLVPRYQPIASENGATIYERAIA